MVLLRSPAYVLYPRTSHLRRDKAYLPAPIEKHITILKSLGQNFRVFDLTSVAIGLWWK
jgi:hypothetical protein